LTYLQTCHECTHALSEKRAAQREARDTNKENITGSCTTEKRSGPKVQEPGE
jgi:hypothetical protein